MADAGTHETPLEKRSTCTLEHVESNDEEHSKTNSNQFKFSSEPSFENVRQMLSGFAAERNWNQFHTPRNLMLALTAEVGELAEVFQWKGELKQGVPEFTESERQHLGEEMSDVLSYLVRLADQCNVDLPAAIVDKIQLNRQKYPVDKVYGKSKKYTDYVNDEL